ncbi:unnamed protein product [Amaranthus hypochondriacus]
MNSRIFLQPPSPPPSESPPPPPPSESPPSPSALSSSPSPPSPSALSSSPSPPSSTSPPSPTPSPSPSYNRYLRPGALAQMRDFKLTTNRRSQICFSLLLLTNSHIQPPTADSNSSMEVGPSFFPLSPHRPRCLRRKKLAALPPIFTP